MGLWQFLSKIMHFSKFAKKLIYPSLINIFRKNIENLCSYQVQIGDSSITSSHEAFKRQVQTFGARQTKMVRVIVLGGKTSLLKTTRRFSRSGLPNHASKIVHHTHHEIQEKRMTKEMHSEFASGRRKLLQPSFNSVSKNFYSKSRHCMRCNSFSSFKVHRKKLLGEGQLAMKFACGFRNRVDSPYGLRLHSQSNLCTSMSLKE